MFGDICFERNKKKKMKKEAQVMCRHFRFAKGYYSLHRNL